MRLGGRQPEPPPFPAVPSEPPPHTHTHSGVCSASRGSLNSPPLRGLTASGAQRSWLGSRLPGPEAPGEEHPPTYAPTPACLQAPPPPEPTARLASPLGKCHRAQLA